MSEQKPKSTEVKTGPRDERKDVVEEDESRYRPIYSVEDVPPWYLCILLGFQIYHAETVENNTWVEQYFRSVFDSSLRPGHRGSQRGKTTSFNMGQRFLMLLFNIWHYLTAFGSTITVPFVLFEPLCIGDDGVGLSQLINTIFFMSGLSTLLQTTFGVRLPIIQGATFAFLAPTFSILNQMGDCSIVTGVNSTIETGSEEHREVWHGRLRAVQGAIIVASCSQVLIGFSGIMGLLLPYIGPLAIAPTISLIGISLFPAAYDFASTQWYIAIMTVFLITLFSQYLQNIGIPCFKFNRKDGCQKANLYIFKLFPVLLAMMLAWFICFILTVSGALTDDVNGWGYLARTDTNPGVIRDSQWFRFPYPGQWGVPTVTVGAVFGMLAGVLASMIESVGDYYACAKISGAPPPPVHAINRGIGMEGIACILAGAWGSGNGTTSYSENIGAIGITKVGSRRVVQVGGLIMIVLGCLGKFGALFVTIPKPVVGGMFLVMFGMVTAVGLSNLQYVDLRSSRNIFVLGVSLFFGLCFPSWMEKNKDAINTGSTEVDQILTILLSTSMFVGGVLGFVLDVTIPGTVEERGVHKMRQTTSGSGQDGRSPVYDLPLIQPMLDKIIAFRRIPFCPSYKPFTFDCCKKKSKTNEYEVTNESFQI